MGFEAQVDSAEGRLKPIFEKVCQLICRMAEKLDRVRMFHSEGTDELPNVKV